MSGEKNNAEAKSHALWALHGYAPWFAADTAFVASGAVNSFALSLLVISATGSPAQAAVVSSITLVVGGVFQFFGGWMQDSFDRRKLALWLGATGVVLFLIGVLLLATDSFTFTTASILAVALGVRGGLLSGVTDIMLRAFVPAAVLPKAMSVNQARDAVFEFGVAPVAGVLLELGRVFPWVANIILNVIAFVASIFLPESISKSQIDKKSTARKPVSIESLLAGFSTIFSIRMLRVLHISGAVFFAVFNTLITVTIWYITASTGNTALAGLTNSAVAVGVFCGAAFAVRLTRVVRGGTLTILGYALPVTTILFLLLFHSSPWHLLFLAPAMVLLPAGSAAIGSLSMLVIPDEKLGRTYAASGIMEVIFGAIITTSLGLLYDRCSYAITLGVGVAVMALCLVSLASVSEIRRIPRADEIEEFADSISNP